jgi:hypothetical protein
LASCGTHSGCSSRSGPSSSLSEQSRRADPLASPGWSWRRTRTAISR